MKTVSNILICLVIYLSYCYGAKLLAVLPTPIHSHHKVFEPILKELASRGHKLTVITASPVDKPNYEQIIISNILDEHKDPTAIFEIRKISKYTNFLFISIFGEKFTEHMLQSSEVQKLIHSNDSHFDAIFIESTFGQESTAAFGHKFQAPLIELSSLCSSFWLNNLISNPNYFSYIIDFWTAYPDKMTFFQRLDNTVFGLLQIISQHIFYMSRQQTLADKYLNYTGYESRPPLQELLSNISLVLLNTHVALHYPYPNNPNVIPIAGLHVKTPTKLPEDLQVYLDNAREGVIYFSFGSNMKSAFMPEVQKQILIKALGKVPFKVLWKWEEDEMPNKPQNIKIAKWLPQTAILAHPNVKAFITHGGILSLTESVYFGVPVIVIPFYGDQYKNSKQAEMAGFSITLRFDDLTIETVISAITDITTQSRFEDAAKKYSSILRDNPMRAMETAVYWIEYIIRYKGAPHLQTAAKQLAWYQYFLIDVLLFLVIVITITLAILYFIFKKVLKSIQGKVMKTHLHTKRKMK